MIESKIIILESGRRVKRYKDVCPGCTIFKGWKDKNALGRECQTCANKKINTKKLGKVFKSDKYINLTNVNTKDFIKVGNVTKYKTTCPKCNADRGYQRPSVFSKKCKPCSSINKTRQDCVDIATTHNLIFLDSDYITYKHKHKWECKKCNNIFIRSLEDMRSTKNCPHCNRFSNENECRKIFKSIFNQDFLSIRPNFLKNPETGYNLELDGYCKELKLAFEYDGEFHYKEMDWIDDRNRLDKVQQRDKLKDSLCKQNDIILVRIPYWENKDLETYINQQLMDLGVNNG